jgi:hypothetical protein
MGYNVEISVNLLKDSKFSEIEKTIQDTAELYECDSIYSIAEEDGTKKIPRYHLLFVINFEEDKFEKLIKFLKIMKKYKKVYIECIFNNTFCKSKLLYASSYYLNNIDKDISEKFKKFISDKQFSPNEKILLKEFYNEVKKLN